MELSIGILGVGRMGQALIGGLLKSAKHTKIFAWDITRNQEKQGKAEENSFVFEKIHWVESSKELENKATIIILCVKPQDMPKALADFTGNKKYISIAAGLSIDYLSQLLKTPRKNLARVMPNIAALSASAVSGVYCEDKNFCNQVERIFNCIGETLRLQIEDKLHAITALSGSGPAIVSAFVQALAEGGVLSGLNYEDALFLAKKTLEGTITLMEDKQLTPAQLRNQITSPAGTTIAALQCLEERGFHGNIMAAIQAATKRSIELGSVENQ